MKLSFKDYRSRELYINLLILFTLLEKLQVKEVVERDLGFKLDFWNKTEQLLKEIETMLKKV